ncbi:MAG: hypothetical protein NTX50_22310 [Candidatus Sumerlaeota bacterium]|nr:hypothetical protein [Candidatus Sumerlaeota bacterium]
MIKPFDWNTIIVGHWNPAILTPKGIAEHLFGKPPDHPIEVLVPLDAIAPFRVKIDELSVSADSGRLHIGCEKCTLDVLDKSRGIAVKAIAMLPKTPLVAAGYNIRYQVEKPSDEFIGLFSMALDGRISDEKHDIVGKEIRRALKWKDGRVNVHISNREAGEYAIVLNFERISSQPDDLKAWLQIPIDDVKLLSANITEKILNLTEEES